MWSKQLAEQTTGGNATDKRGKIAEKGKTMQSGTDQEVLQYIRQVEEGYKQFNVARLFQGFPCEVQQDAAVIAKCVEKCGEELYDTGGEGNPFGASYSIDRGSCLVALFEVLPEHTNKDSDLCAKFIDRCPLKFIDDLFNLFPDSIQKDSTVCSTAVKKSPDVQKLFAQLPDVMKKDAAVWSTCIMNYAGVSEEDVSKDAVMDKCYKYIYQSSEVVLKEEAIAVACIDKVAFIDIENLMNFIPQQVQERKRIKKAKDKKSGSGGMLQKQYPVLKTAARLLFVMFAFGGSVEATMYGIGHALGKETMEIHWQRQSKSWLFTPMPECPLPPPQPLFMSLSFDALKPIAFTVMFGYINRHLQIEQNEHATRFKRIVFVMASIFQLAIVPLSAALSIKNFATDIYPHLTGFWAVYQCFYIRWNSSFLDFSYWLLAIRAVGTNAILHSSGKVLRANHAKHQCDTSFFTIEWLDWGGVFNPRRQLKDLEAALLDKPVDDAPGQTLRIIENKKYVVYMNALAITACIFITIDIPFIFTHKIPAGVAFSPFLFIFGLLILMSQYFTWPEGARAAVNAWRNNLKEGYHRSWEKARHLTEVEYANPHEPLTTRFCIWQYDRGIIQGGVEYVKCRLFPENLLADFAERTGYLVFLPLLFGMAAIDLILSYGSVYLYDGAGYISSMVLVIAERHWDRYADGFMTKILSKFAWSTSLVNEVL